LPDRSFSVGGLVKEKRKIQSPTAEMEDDKEERRQRKGDPDDRKRLMQVTFI